jgi:hypothetical protein
MFTNWWSIIDRGLSVHLGLEITVVSEELHQCLFVSSRSVHCHKAHHPKDSPPLEVGGRRNAWQAQKLDHSDVIGRFNDEIQLKA